MNLLTPVRILSHKQSIKVPTQVLSLYSYMVEKKIRYCSLKILMIQNKLQQCDLFLR